MKLEQQVSNLNLSKILKELGAKQNSLYYWHFTMYKESDYSNDDARNDKPLSKAKWSKWKQAEKGQLWEPFLTDESDKKEGGWILKEQKDAYSVSKSYFVSAFTATELGELLPERVESIKSGKIWICDYYDGEKQFADTEVDARAKMLIYLLENKLIKL